jgi:hypothetical protein
MHLLFGYIILLSFRLKVIGVWNNIQADNHLRKKTCIPIRVTSLACQVIERDFMGCNI